MANHFHRAEGLFTLARDGKSEGYRIRVAPPTASVFLAAHARKCAVPTRKRPGCVGVRGGGRGAGLGPLLGRIPQQCSLAAVMRYGCVSVRKVKQICPSAAGAGDSFEGWRKAWGKIVLVGGLSVGVFHGILLR